MTAKTNNYQLPLVFGLDIGTRSIVGTVGYQEDNKFNIIGHYVVEHETRAMIDGQIHDIPKVADAIRKVKNEIEKQINIPLTEVCIAAAGRVLKTASVIAEYNFPDETVVNEEHVYSLELLGVEMAHEEVYNLIEGVRYHCVGYSVVKYFLNDYMMTNLIDHKGRKISAELLATFLPEEVIDGLYSAVNQAGLEVASLTLEPIAAINVAIPEQYRLLNLALVDIGAGTSDISITKDGSIIAYGMIPDAGDEITEVIVNTLLVDFKTAEKIKLSLSKDKTISYKDIMGLSHKVEPRDVLDSINEAINILVDKIASKILHLNAEKSVNAVFCVGGGGKIPKFTELLAERLSLPVERVALRGAEVLKDINIVKHKLKKDPLLVTPIGICLSYYVQKNNFIFVTANGDKLKIYNNNKLTIIDIAVQVGFTNDKLFPKRGKEITYKLNGKSRIIRGLIGEPAKILLNGEEVGINHPIKHTDEIVLIESTTGEDANCEVRQLIEFPNNITFDINGQKIICPVLIEANGKMVNEYYNIQDNDDINILNYYTVEQLLTYMDIKDYKDIMVNGSTVQGNDVIYENFIVNIEYETINISGELNKPDSSNKTSLDIHILVNQEKVTLNNKNQYIFVDIFDVYKFDLSEPKGRLITKLNGKDALFTDVIDEGDSIEIFWEG